MKVGDLVVFFYRSRGGRPGEIDTDLGAGLITGFDMDDDPIVMFPGRKSATSPLGDAYLKNYIRVISESR